MYQHDLETFQLVDKSRLGHLKYVAFFLVDLSSPLGDQIVSTSRVLLQQADWVADVWAGEQERAFPPQIPHKVVDMIVNQVEAAMTRDEAKTHARFMMNGYSRCSDQVEEWAYGRVPFRL
ncbi:hypothetical protein AMAG_09789 [Allomyces macrogynus ATCC 38327]|uniref:DUF4246 domain-containing protein n=1 Tax=Allomyces macrogynus (strain ATCC 38327) TaxID=578462 RepID=A0A0L0STF8_ALLM3|nr:hypothetical protein AMAG_09789 [Allomyces macrogynus ATCC 38327]|eukprot:KNE65818.1 hypothetical protein AMAG_09789 [Allomyces macrogynus ATCC 38327]